MMKKILPLVLLLAALLGAMPAQAQANFNGPSPFNNSVYSPLLKACHAQYNFAVDGGVAGLITPAVNCTIPANAIIVSETINVTTAPLSLGSATVAVGTSATGGAANSFLAATGKASLTLNSLFNGAVTFASPLKVTVAGPITITIGTANLTAGVIEIWVQYFIASN